jgi:uncharacterized membrane protein YjgN (DUF898 family)
MSFTGRPWEFLRMLLGGSLLLIPTLGFYRFWLTTDIRRHLWGHTRIGDESFEYTGTGRELLIGFLIALAVLAPVYVAYFILGVVAENLQAFASIPLIVILYGFSRYALFRARRYRATRTIFRGVRFWMTGSAWAYAGRALLWDLGTVLTLGLLYPWRVAALERYKMRNTRFGDLAGDFVATGGALFRRGWWLWVTALLMPAVAGFTEPGLFLGLLMLLVFPVIYALLRVIQLRWQLEGIRLGPVSVSSDLNGGEVFGCYAGMVVAMALFGFLAFSVAVGVASGGSLSAPRNWDVLSGLGTFAALALVYLVLLIGLGVIKQYFLDRGVWKAVAATSTIVNVAALDGVAATGDPAGSLGEGLADALDFGGI